MVFGLELEEEGLAVVGVFLTLFCELVLEGGQLVLGV